MQMIQSLLQHMEWANQRILTALPNDQVSKEASTLFAHVLMAEQTWLARLEGRDHTIYPLWEKTGRKKCERLIEMNNGMFLDYLQGEKEQELLHPVTYTNSKGKEYQNTKLDILLHVVLHGQYHRGQINKKLRETGEEPINIDYITYQREKWE